ncbi:unnamed protein product, partial [Prorocentrum cordatum]
ARDGGLGARDQSLQHLRFLAYASRDGFQLPQAETHPGSIRLVRLRRAHRQAGACARRCHLEAHFSEQSGHRQSKQYIVTQAHHIPIALNAAASELVLHQPVLWEADGDELAPGSAPLLLPPFIPTTGADTVQPFYATCAPSAPPDGVWGRKAPNSSVVRGHPGTGGGDDDYLVTRAKPNGAGVLR